MMAMHLPCVAPPQEQPGMIADLPGDDLDKVPDAQYYAAQFT
jgi:hypothetical protein